MAEDVGGLRLVVVVFVVFLGVTVVVCGVVFWVDFSFSVFMGS